MPYSPTPRTKTLAQAFRQRVRVRRLVRLPSVTETLGEAAKAGRVVPWVLDPVTGRVLQVGDSCAAVLGVHGDALLLEPQALEGLLQAPQRELFRTCAGQALQGCPSGFEAPLWHGADGRQVWTRWTVEATGNLLRGTIQDISETHELQEQLLQSQKLGHLGTFLSGITHDFNNILMGIMGYSEMLLMDPALTPLQKRSLDVIDKAATRGRSLADHLLRLVREDPPERRAANLNEVIAEVQELLGAPGANRVTLELDLDPQLPLTNMDTTQMHQVIMNLAVNARDALGGEGRITCRTRALPGGTQEPGTPEGPCILLEMEDTGRGIAPEHLDRIFTLFFTTKGTGRGSGLGLALVQAIVRSHGGVIRCTSKVGQGTVFRILLPVRTERIRSSTPNGCPFLVPEGDCCKRPEACGLMSPSPWPYS